MRSRNCARSGYGHHYRPSLWQQSPFGLRLGKRVSQMDQPNEPDRACLVAESRRLCAEIVRANQTLRALPRCDADLVAQLSRHHDRLNDIAAEGRFVRSIGHLCSKTGSTTVAWKTRNEASNCDANRWG